MQKTTTEAEDGRQKAEGLLVRHEAGAVIAERVRKDAGKRNSVMNFSFDELYIAQINTLTRNILDSQERDTGRICVIIFVHFRRNSAGNVIYQK